MTVAPWLPWLTWGLLAVSLTLLMRTARRLMDPRQGELAAERLVDRQPLFLAGLVLVLAGMTWIVRANVAMVVEGVPTDGALYRRLTFTGHALSSVGLMGLTLVLEADANALPWLPRATVNDSGHGGAP